MTYKHSDEAMEKGDYKRVNVIGEVILYEGSYSCPINALLSQC